MNAPQKILIIEDNPNLCELYSMAFLQAGFNVESCLNGSDGIKALKKFDPDIILLDIMMPETDGLTVLKKLQNKTNIKIVIISNLLNNSIRDECYRLGAADFIKKTEFTPKETVERVKLVQKTKEPMPPPKRSAPTLMIIEDNKDESEMLSHALTQKKFQVEIYNDGLVGLTHAIANNPDIILLDLMLPEIDGLELLKRIRKNKKNKSHIIIISQISSEKKINQAKKLGAQDFIEKSKYTPDQVAEKVLDCWETAE